MRNVDEVLNQSLPTPPSELKEPSADGLSRQLLAAIIAFRDGDFSVRLPVDWDGRRAGLPKRSTRRSRMRIASRRR